MRLVVALALVVSLSHGSLALPQAYSPALAVYHTDSVDNPNGTVQVSINGLGFGSVTLPQQTGSSALADCGTAAGGSFVVVYSGLTPIFTARTSSTSEISAWSDQQIVILLSSSVGASPSLQARVCTPAGMSTLAAIAKWTYTHVDIPPTPTTNALPDFVARTADGNVWVNEEFHDRQIKRYSPTTSSWQTFPVGQNASGIFVAFNQRSTISVLAEDAIVDSFGRVWLSEGGGAFDTGIPGSHSRIIVYDPAVQQVHTLNLPGDQTAAFGLAWDPVRKRIWFAQTRRQIGSAVAHPGRLVSFDPICIDDALGCNGTSPHYSTLPSWNSTFDFDANAATWTCVGGSTGPTPTVGTCQSGTTNNGYKCFTSQDCVFSNVVCPANNVYDYWCFREYEIPDTNGAVSIPNHVLAHSDSTIWYTAYFGGNHLGRLDPSTKQFQVYPLPQPRDEASCNYGSCICFFGETCPHRCCAYLIQGLGPGSVAEEASRNVVMSFQYQPAVGRFDFSRANDPACTQLDANGQNPCVSFSFLPSFNPDTQGGHSAAVDGNGNVWLTMSGPSSDCSTLTSVAYQQATTNRMLTFPPLSFYPQIVNGTCVGFNGAGMAYDPSTGGMWFADFSRHRIGKMQPQ